MTLVLEHDSDPYRSGPGQPEVDAEGRPSVEAGEPAVRRDIQGLRAVAVTLVVLYHSHVPGIRGGYVGVDVFFVISGYLITGRILREVDESGRLSLPAFYGRRLRRLLPAALLVVLTTLIVAWRWGPALQLRSTATDAIWTASYALNLRLAGQGVNYEQANGPQSPLQHFWSLAVEEQFYLAWPIIIVFTLLVARRLYRVALGAMAVVGVGASLALCVRMTSESAPSAYFSVQTRAWEFGLGALVAIAVRGVGLINGVVRGLATWVGLGLIVGAALRYDDATAFPGIAAAVPVAGSVLVIAGGCGCAPWRGAEALLGRSPMQAIGRFSYAWYLWHWPMLVLAPSVLGHSLSWIRDVEISLLALWLAGLTYAVVERPTQRGHVTQRGWLVRGVGLSGVTALAGVVVLATSPAIAGDGDDAKPVDLAGPRATVLSLALDAATLTRRAPANLSPSLSDAASDVPITEGACHLEFLQVNQGQCVYGDPHGTKTVVLFGDSHAEQWDGALNAEAKALHWKLVSWTKSACPVADVSLVHPTLKRVYRECDVWRARTIERIQRLHPALVIASQSDDVPGQMLSNATWADRTVTSLEQLGEGGARVVFLADTPEPKGDAPSCIADNRDDLQVCDVPRSGAYHDLNGQNASLYLGRHDLVISTLRSAGFAVADPVDWFCGATTCPVVVGNTLIYRDDSHVTNTYSTQLAPLFRPLFEERVT